MSTQTTAAPVVTRQVRYDRPGTAATFAAAGRDALELGADGRLRIAADSPHTVNYADPHVTGAQPVQYVCGSWTSPVHEIGFPATEAILSWEARTDTATWVETSFRGRHADGNWTAWYVMCRWTSGNDFANGDIHRTSLLKQSDEHGSSSGDAFIAAAGFAFDAYQVRAMLAAPPGSGAAVELGSIGLMVSTLESCPPQTSGFTLGERVELDVPLFSQRIHAGAYPHFDGGGDSWCSPTSMAMVLYYWDHRVSDADLASVEAPNGDPQVPWTTHRTYDYAYDGAGNWSFNTAHAAGTGVTAFVTRLRSLAEAEAFIARGIPVVVSVAFKQEQIPGSGYDTNGHLLVIIGFTETGQVLVNDPYSADNAAVRREYDRAGFETAWLTKSGGACYIVHPPGVDLPAPPAGAPRNW